MTKNSLNSATAKYLIQHAKTRADKTIIALGTFETCASIKEIQTALAMLGEPGSKKWNLSQTLSAANKRAVRTSSGWELTAKGSAELSSNAAQHGGSSSIKISAETLRKLLPGIQNPDVRAFIEEGIGCIENNLLKAAAVFTWVGALAVLHHFVVTNHLITFNADAVKKDPNWRPAKNTDGLGLMKESDFLDALVRIGVLGKNVKTELKTCLDLRNGCGHPNSLAIGEAKILAHVETLVLNVFSKY